MCRFLVDSNFFIQNYRMIPMDIFPSFWSAFGELLEADVAVIHETVYQELKGHKDAIVPWIQSIDVDPMKTTEEALEKYIEICEWATRSETYSSEAKRIFTDDDRADAWLCAEALASGLSVVSYETASNSIKKIKIPNVCVEFGIPCVGGHEFMRGQGFQF